MTRFILPLTLLLTTTALACPVKAGYVANGQFKNTTGLVPQCSAAFKKIAAEVKVGEYGEIYKTTFDLKGALAIKKLSGLLTSNGWKQTGASNKGQNKALVFDKGTKQTVIAVKEEPVEQGDDYVLVVLIGDK
ncbi:hypothetical protein [Deinococcus sp. UYEF24]